MDFGHEDEDDEAALARRRANLRAFVEDVAEAVQALPMPDTYLEAERSVRAVTVADRFIANVPEDEEEEGEDTAPAWASRDTSPFRCETQTKALHPTRKALRGYADRLMDAVCRIAKPDCFLEAERAGRYALACERMLVQLYAAPKRKPPFGDDYHDDAYSRRPRKEIDYRPLILQKLTGKSRAEVDEMMASPELMKAPLPLADTPEARTTYDRLMALFAQAGFRDEESDEDDQPGAPSSSPYSDPANHPYTPEPIPPAPITPPQAEPRIRSFGPYPFRPPP